jgi:PAS domain S-box-containing protein
VDHSRDILRSQKAEVLRGLIDKLFHVVIVIGSLIGIFSAIHIAYKGCTFDSLSDIFFVTFAVLIMVFRRKVPPNLMAIFLISLIGIDGLTKLLESGLNGLSGLSLAVCCIAAGVFFGFRAGMFVLAGIIIAIVTTAVLSFSGGVHLHDNPSRGSPVTWIIRVLTITIYVSGLGLLISGIQRRLAGSLKTLSERSSELEHSIVQLNAEIASRRAAEDKLIKEEQKYRLLAENMQDVLVVQDLTNKILYVSPSAKAVFGYEIDEALNLSIDTFFTAESLKVANATFKNHLALVLQGGRPVLPFFEIEYRHKNGNTFPGEVSAQFLYDSDGKPYGTQCLIRDITKRKQAEEELLKMESHLRQIQKLEALGVLAGGIAHDFNNLMSGIFAYIDLAKLETDAGKRSQHLSMALASIDRARGLTRQLLTFAKGGAPERKTEPLGTVLLETAQFALSGSSVSCACSIPGDLWPVAFDRSQITQVIDNIVINAQQAMLMGGTIEVTAQNAPLDGTAFATLPEGNYVKVSIRDHGIGIPHDLLPRIFDPFFTTKEKGHGLGLATCYSIVKQHDGLIDVDSEPGKGSTFHIYLPASSKKVAVVPDMPAKQFKGSGCILVMDDDKTVRRAIVEMLQVLGFSAVEAVNGSDALQQYQAKIHSGKSFTALIVDLTVPGGMGGMEMIDTFRKTDATTPAFVTSGYADDSAMIYPEKHGFTAGLRKPCTLSELSALLEMHLKKD